MIQRFNHQTNYIIGDRVIYEGDYYVYISNIADGDYPHWKLEKPPPTHTLKGNIITGEL